MWTREVQLRTPLYHLRMTAFVTISYWKRNATHQWSLRPSYSHSHSRSWLFPLSGVSTSMIGNTKPEKSCFFFCFTRIYSDKANEPSVCLSVCTCMYVCMLVCICLYVCAYVHVCMYVCVSMCMYVCMCVYVCLSLIKVQ